MIMKAVQAALMLVAAAILMAQPAAARCTCVCKDGKVRNACSNSFDTEIICNKICPINILPPGAPQPITEGEGLASDSGRTRPMDSFVTGGQSQ